MESVVGVGSCIGGVVWCVFCFVKCDNLVMWNMYSVCCWWLVGWVVFVGGCVNLVGYGMWCR